MKKYSFVVGECLKEDQKYQFRCKDRNYHISVTTPEGTEKIIFRSGNMQEAYARWREIKGGGQKNGHTSQKRSREK